MKTKTTTILAGALSLVIAGTAQAALESRLGGQAYYDTTLKITWLTDANLALTNQFGLNHSTLEFDDKANTVGSTGRMTWGNAQAWIGGMNTANYLGSSNWRLPTMLDTGTSGCDFAYTGTDCGFNVQTGSAATTVYSEMASLFYDTLGNKAYYDTAGNPNQPGWGLSNTGPFLNLQSNDYWSGLEYAPNNFPAWFFLFLTGSQGLGPKDFNGYAWAVQSGDVGVVPVPAAVWLFGSGLFGLIGLGRLRRR